MRKFARLLALVMAAMAVSAQKVWDGTKWISRAAFGPPVPAGEAIEEAFDDVAQALSPVTPSQPAVAESVTPSAPAPTPMPAPAKVVEIDPVLAKGRAAHAFAHAMLTADEPSTAGLDDAAAAWLNSLNASELMKIHQYGAHRVGSHMAGLRPIEGLPLCPSMAEYRHALGAAARITPAQRADIKEWQETMDRAFEEMIEDPAYELKCGI